MAFHSLDHPVISRALRDMGERTEEGGGEVIPPNGWNTNHQNLESTNGFGVWAVRDIHARAGENCHSLEHTQYSTPETAVAPLGPPGTNSSAFCNILPLARNWLEACTARPCAYTKQRLLTTEMLRHQNRNIASVRWRNQTEDGRILYLSNQVGR